MSKVLSKSLIVQQARPAGGAEAQPRPQPGQDDGVGDRQEGLQQARGGHQGGQGDPLQGDKRLPHHRLQAELGIFAVCGSAVSFQMLLPGQSHYRNKVLFLGQAYENNLPPAKLT